ncbi:hypothetical protein CC876_24610 [Salmonella enterica subsp. enterica serovar Kisarawe]|nr:hypothetical protein [Salmonella enterica]EDI0749184.1 hypothetical protein [Salmonella enterica subsp. enterica serovar Kisarawe]
MRAGVENASGGKPGQSDLFIRDGAGGPPVEVVADGTGRKEAEIGESGGNPCKNAAAVMNGESAAGVFVNIFFSIKEDTDLHETKGVVVRPEERKDLSEEGEFLASVPPDFPAHFALYLFTAQKLTLFFVQSGGMRLRSDGVGCFLLHGFSGAVPGERSRRKRSFFLYHHNG